MPYYSQYGSTIPLNWKNRGCGIVALKMLFDYWHSKNSENKTVALKNLLGNGGKDAFIKDVGWSHAGLVSIARDYGYDGFNKDLVLSGADANEGFRQLKNDLKYFPIMASVWNQFDPARGGGHLVIVTGIHAKKVYIKDPGEENEKSGFKTLPEQEFIKAFKRRYIAIYPKNAINRLQKIEIFNIELAQSYLAMIKNSMGTKMFRNLYINTPSGKKDVLNNGQFSCSVFVSYVLYGWGLITDTHAKIDPAIRDMLGFGWYVIKEPREGCIIEWDYKLMNGSHNKHLGFYLGKEKAISNRQEKGFPIIHHWTFGIDKNKKPKRKILNLYWHDKLNPQN